MIASVGRSDAFLLGILLIFILLFTFWLGLLVIRKKRWPIIILSPLVLAFWIVWVQHATRGFDRINTLNRGSITIFIIFSFFLFFFTYFIIYSIMSQKNI
jgi:hypothetical protein